MSKELQEHLIQEITPKKTPFHLNEDGPDFLEFDNSKYGEWLPRPQDLVSQCLLQPDEPYVYQEIEPYTLKVLEERKRKQASQFVGDLPFDLHGVDQIPSVSQKQLITQFIRRNGIKRDKIPVDTLAHLKRSLVLLANNDALPQQRYQALFQKQIAEKIMKQKEKLREEGVELKWDQSQDLELEIQNSIFVKGVHLDRSKNGTNYDYIIEQKNEERGLQEYIHKYFMGDNLIYPTNALGSPNLKVFDSALEIQHFLQQSKQKIIWKLVVKVKTQRPLQAWKSNKALHSSESTGLHLVVFENELKTPPHITLCDLEFEDWVHAHRYFPWNWRISDIDFYMKGNPYYSAKVDLRKMESLKPQIKEVPNFMEQRLSQIYGIKSVQAAKPTFNYPAIKIYHLDKEEAEGENEEEEKTDSEEKALHQIDIDWADQGPTKHQRMNNERWIPYVSDNVFEQ